MVVTLEMICFSLMLDSEAGGLKTRELVPQGFGNCLISRTG